MPAMRHAGGSRRRVTVRRPLLCLFKHNYISPASFDPAFFDRAFFDPVCLRGGGGRLRGGTSIASWVICGRLTFAAGFAGAACDLACPASGAARTRRHPLRATGRARLLLVAPCGPAGRAGCRGRLLQGPAVLLASETVRDRLDRGLRPSLSHGPAWQGHVPREGGGRLGKGGCGGCGHDDGHEVPTSRLAGAAGVTLRGIRCRSGCQSGDQGVRMRPWPAPVKSIASAQLARLSRVWQPLGGASRVT